MSDIIPGPGSIQLKSHIGSIGFGAEATSLEALEEKVLKGLQLD
ncbi:hypothetical protein [Paenibacillus lutimineralis]|nr:hypothetical protein [Paenibacillus lutimineralis]